MAIEVINSTAEQRGGESKEVLLWFWIFYGIQFDYSTSIKPFLPVHDVIKQ